MEQEAKMESSELAEQLKLTFQWLYAFTLTRLVTDQLALLRLRLLSVKRFQALPRAGYAPEGIAEAIERNPDRRKAVVSGLVVPLLENWGLGMTTAKIASCFDVDGILFRSDVHDVLQALLNPASASKGMDGIDLSALRTRITTNLKTLHSAVYTASIVHPRQVVIDAPADETLTCNLFLPHTWPTTAQGESACVGVLPSASERNESNPQIQKEVRYPRPFYERAPNHTMVAWEPVFIRVVDLKRYDQLSGDPAWDDTPIQSKKIIRKGANKWDYKLKVELDKCEQSFNEIEGMVLQSDIGGPTASFLSLVNPLRLLQNVLKVLPVLSPSNLKNAGTTPDFSIARVFQTMSARGPTRQRGHYEYGPQRALFLQLYGEPTDFIPVTPEARSGSSKTTNGDSSVKLMTSNEDDSEPIYLDIHAILSERDERQISAYERDTLLRSAQASRDAARSHTHLPAVGLLLRNEVMQSLREEAAHAFVRSEKAQVRLAYRAWTALSTELSREAIADRCSAALRKQANVEERIFPRTVEEGWDRSVTNAVDVSIRDGWDPPMDQPDPSQHQNLFDDGGNPTRLLELEAGLKGGVWVDPSLELNRAAALLKLGSGADAGIGEEMSFGEAVVQASSSALSLLTAQPPASLNDKKKKTDTCQQPTSNEETPVIELRDCTGPAAVLDTIAFWLGGGRRGMVQMDDFDRGYYGFGYEFASQRISDDVRAAVRRERRAVEQKSKPKSSKLCPSLPRNEDEFGSDEDEAEKEVDDEEEEEEQFAFWDEEADDEPLGGIGTHWPIPKAGETEQQAKDRIGTQRRRVRLARAAVRARLEEALSVQLGLASSPGSAHGSSATARTLGVTPALSDSLLAPGRKRTRKAWEALVWKGLVRRGKGRAEVLRQMPTALTDTRGPMSQEEKGKGTEDASSKANDGTTEHNGDVSEKSDEDAANSTRDSETPYEDAAKVLLKERKQTAALARKDFEMALAMDPAAADIPRQELDALETLVAGMSLQ